MTSILCLCWAKSFFCSSCSSSLSLSRSSWRLSLRRSGRVRHYETTLEVLGELGAGDKPMIVVLNKLDLVPEEERAALTERLAPHFNGSLVCMSVREGQGTEDLLRACVEMLESRVRRARFLIPYTRSDLAAAMHSEGMVISTEYVEEGALVEAVLPVAFYNKVNQFLAEPSCEE